MSENIDSSAERSHTKDLVQSGIKSGLETIGSSAASATLYFIETKSALRLEDIPDRPKDFCRALQAVFGLGSTLLIRSILDRLQVIAVATEGEREYLTKFTNALEASVRSEA